MRIFNVDAYHRVVIGRNITLTAGAVYALSRFLYYATINPADLSPAQNVVTGNSHLLGAWAGAWCAAAIVCVMDMVNRHTKYGLSMVVGLALAWGFAYLGMWIFTGFTDFSLFSSAVSWLTPAGLVFGLLLKVTALRDMLDHGPPVVEAADD